MKELIILAFLLGLSGCADSQQAPSSADGVEFVAQAELKNSAHVSDETVSLGRAPAMESITFAGGGGQNVDKSDIPPQRAITRKIIYSAEVQLIVESLEASEKQLKQLIQQHNGQIASSDLRGQSGSQRSGRWKVRIPVEQFDAFKALVEKIGNLERSSTSSSDVTEEFYDVEARLKNKKVEETRLVQHLEKSTAKLSDILEVEKELSRVRSEIERMQGRLNMLANLTSLTTIEVSIREVKNYVPPTAPSFGDDASRSFSSSWAGLVNFGRKATLAVVSLVPWLPVILVAGVVLLYLVRWLRRYRPKPVVAQLASLEGV